MRFSGLKNKFNLFKNRKQISFDSAQFAVNMTLFGQLGYCDRLWVSQSFLAGIFLSRSHSAERTKQMTGGEVGLPNPQ